MPNPKKRHSDVAVDTVEAKTPKANVNISLTPCEVSDDIRTSLADYRSHLEEALYFPAEDWPEGREVEFTVEFNVTPSKITTRFRQK